MSAHATDWKDAALTPEAVIYEAYQYPDGSPAWQTIWIHYRKDGEIKCLYLPQMGQKMETAEVLAKMLGLTLSLVNKTANPPERIGMTDKEAV